MLFNSFTFATLFVFTFCIYYLPALRKLQVPILIAASFVFYAWSLPILLLLLIFSILINALTSYKTIHSVTKTSRLFWASLGVTANLTILGLFKYGALLTNLFLDILQVSAPSESIVALLLNLPLPIGISFYTFQGISLVVDVLREQKNIEQPEKSQNSEFGRQKSFFAQKSKNKILYLFNTSFFISFFPQLIAGPIVKASEFYPQIKTKYFKEIPWEIVFRSLTIGYFMKMVVADNLKDYTFWISYPYYQRFGTLTNLVLLFGYSMQIFADFAGYSLIAIGLAASLGYTLPQNFNFPYISRSLAEFWNRWHISLSSWLKYYLYIPLGGNKKGKARTYINLMIVMALGGLWHGAAWSYAVWGIYHGIGLAVERLWQDWKNIKKNHEQSRPLWQDFLVDSIQAILVFSFVSIGWLLFKLTRLEQAVDFIGTLIKNINIPPSSIYIVPVLFLSLPVILYHLPHFTPLRKAFEGVNFKETLLDRLQDIAFAVMLFLLVLNSGSSTEFIYFQF